TLVRSHRKSHQASHSRKSVTSFWSERGNTPEGTTKLKLTPMTDGAPFQTPAWCVQNQKRA
ncbi:MAG: hypothetical protein RID09_30690, partial [Coleofasciculus sp. G1-WW12-02]|uniref:hypothetical protein n=1 Tax=Coleofasciculus sp. G1-WW12-02 TaxID=3068483 RepID=UPI0032FD42F6